MRARQPKWHAVSTISATAPLRGSSRRASRSQSSRASWGGVQAPPRRWRTGTAISEAPHTAKLSPHSIRNKVNEGGHRRRHSRERGRTHRSRKCLNRNGAPCTTRTCDLLVRSVQKRGKRGQRNTAAPVFHWG